MDEPPITVTDDPARPGAARLLLRGRVTVADAAGFHRTALGLVARGVHVSVDCGGADYLDAAAVQVVIGLGRELARREKRCDVTGVGGRLAEVLRLAGLWNGAAG